MDEGLSRAQVEIVRQLTADVERLHAENVRLKNEIASEREASATVAESFARDYGPDVAHMAKRIAEVIRRRPRRNPGE